MTREKTRGRGNARCSVIFAAVAGRLADEPPFDAEDWIEDGPHAALFVDGGRAVRRLAVQTCRAIDEMEKRKAQMIAEAIAAYKRGETP